MLLRLRARARRHPAPGRGERVLVVAHQVVVLLIRYVLEGMTEEQVLAVDAEGDVANCSVTTYAGARAAWCARFNQVDHLRTEADVTAEPDAPVARR